MSMTENEEKLFNKLMEHNSAYYGYELSKGEIKTVLQAFEQLKQYKEIGTVQGYERAIQCSLENYNLYKEYKSKVQDYEAIGTVEQLKTMFDGYWKLKDLCEAYEKYGLPEDYWKLNEICKEYSAIGTVEEFKAFRSDDFTEDLLNVGFAKGYNKAVDEFTERLKEKLKAMSDEPAYYHENEDYFVGICSAENVVDDIAEQLKNGTDVGKENEDIER